MQRTKRLSLQIAAAVILAALWSTSVFAESRHRQGTSNRVDHGRIQRSQPGFGTRGAAGGRFESRGDRFRSMPSWHGGAAPYRPHERITSYGRVDRFVRERNGYRVWIGGGRYPIFIPHSYWHRSPLRVGLFIRFGGYWDPLGYWSVYDYAPYDRYDSAYTTGVLHGVVESIDYRRGTLVLNDDISRQFVTVRMPRDRRMDDVRPGDYLELSGAWNRGGVFEAYRLDEWDYGRDDRRY